MQRALTKVTAKLPASISVYPNPVAAKKMMVQFSSQAAGNYVLQLNNKLGQPVFCAAITTSGSSFSKIITLPPNITTGNYQLSITSAHGSRTVLQVILE